MLHLSGEERLFESISVDETNWFVGSPGQAIVTAS